MCGDDGVGVDPTAAEQNGAEAMTLAQRYATISTDFQSEMFGLSEASRNESQVVNGALDYCADIVGQLTQLQQHTRDLGANGVAGAAAARRADDEIGTGLGTIFAA
ncbi:hypothetical protein BH24ACT9_BH24ACT9_16000 [soil metagenome]